MKKYSVLFLLGTSSIYLFHRVPHQLYLLLLLCAGNVALLFFWRHLLLKLSLVFLLGVFWVLLASQWQLQHRIPVSWAHRATLVTGRVESLPGQESRYSSFLFRFKKQKKFYLLKVNWYHTKQKLQLGEQWQLLLKLDVAHDFANPAGFDYKKWLFSRGIGGIAYVITSKNNKRLHAANYYLHPIAVFREYLLAKLKISIGGQHLSEMIYALIIGYRAEIQQQEWQVLQNTGTAHLLAIAGLHVGLVASMMYFLINRLWRLSVFCMHRVPAQIAASVAALIAAVLYSALAGFALPTQRASIMLGIFLLALILKRQIAVWQSISVALFLILILEPLEVLSVSFWLSFTVVTFIIYAMSGRLAIYSKWQELGRLQIVVFFAILPLSLLIFHQLAWLSPLLNALAIPWVGFVVLPCSLLACLLVCFSHLLAHGLWWFAVKNLQLLWAVLQFFSKQHYFVWQHQLSLVGSLFAFILVFLLLSAKGFPGKYLTVFLLLPIIFSSPAHVKPGVNLPGSSAYQGQHLAVWR